MYVYTLLDIFSGALKEGELYRYKQLAVIDYFIFFYFTISLKIILYHTVMEIKTLYPVKYKENYHCFY